MSESRALSGPEIVERVIEAIRGALLEGGAPTIRYDREAMVMQTWTQADYEMLAIPVVKAFLDAIEEPSDAMQIAAVDAHGTAMMARIAPAANMLVSARMWASTANSGDLIPVWRAMIAALRKEIAG